ncbi:ATP-binding protein [Erythrobacter aureus]|uniref:histidine kinase n=1 Tax=Erythrobacter aureus TaxID=2182384 RepID=A0A345YJ92_9SPHN|nr:ATP-binding protein [Erythrobacter aureus]AXK43994.1 PAS domain S-box protein [Erythrobacter aureus]
MLYGVTDEQVSSLLQNWKVGVVGLRPDFTLEFVNAEAERIDGRVAEELIGRSVWEVLPNVVGTEVEELIRLAMETRKGGTAPLYRTSRPGRTIFLEIRVQPWGKGVALFILDVTNWVQLESEKERLEEKYMLASRASPDIQYEWNIKDNIWDSQGGHESLYPGIVTPTEIGEFTARIHPDDRERMNTLFRQTLLSGKAHWAFEYRVNRNGVWANVEDRAFIVYDEEGMPVRAVGVMKDVSETAARQMEITRLQSELIHVSRVSAMGTMASVLAHELNQPLAAIGSYLAGAERLLEEADEIDRELLLQAVREAHAGSSRAGKIIQRLRSMTMKAEHKRDWTNISKAVDNAVSLALIGRTELRDTLSIDISPKLQVQADEIQIEQVLLNLIRNALEANEEAGRSGVKISARELSVDMIGISIADVGNGIPADLQPKLFDFFVSTKDDGMGIGLPISRTIVEAHGGKISIEDREPYGAVFRLMLPINGH